MKAPTAPNARFKCRKEGGTVEEYEKQHMGQWDKHPKSGRSFCECSEFSHWQNQDQGSDDVNRRLLPKES